MPNSTTTYHPTTVADRRVSTRASHHGLHACKAVLQGPPARACKDRSGSPDSTAPRWGLQSGINPLIPRRRPQFGDVQAAPVRFFAAGLQASQNRQHTRPARWSCKGATEVAA